MDEKRLITENYLFLTKKNLNKWFHQQKNPNKNLLQLPAAAAAAASIFFHLKIIDHFHSMDVDICVCGSFFRYITQKRWWWWLCNARMCIHVQRSAKKNSFKLSKFHCTQTSFLDFFRKKIFISFRSKVYFGTRNQDLEKRSGKIIKGGANQIIRLMINFSLSLPLMNITNRAS